MDSAPQIDDVSGNVVTVSVNNSLSFDEETRWFTSFLVINATVNVPATQYTIDVFDQASGNFLTSLSGTVANGQINAEWNLEDAQGQITANGPLVCNFYLQNSGAPPPSSPSASVLYGHINHIQGQSFTIAYGFDGQPAYQTQMGVNVLGSGLSAGIINVLNTQSDYFYENWGGGLDYNLLPSINQTFTDSFQWHIASTGDYGTLLNALTNNQSANFYWWGHGNTDHIGPDSHKGFATTPGDTLASINIANPLGNHPIKGIIKRPYRLVIMQCCEAGSYRYWANAFGIIYHYGGSSYTVTDYEALGRDPQSFVGWVPNINFPLAADDLAVMGGCQSDLFEEWQLGVPISTCKLTGLALMKLITQASRGAFLTIRNTIMITM